MGRKRKIPLSERPVSELPEAAAGRPIRSAEEEEALAVIRSQPHGNSATSPTSETTATTAGEGDHIARNHSTSSAGIRVIQGWESPRSPASPASPYSLDNEGVNPPCPCCVRNVPCLFFYGQVFFSLIILLVAVFGLAGWISESDGCFNTSFYSNLITMVVALWIGRSTRRHSSVFQPT